MSIAQLVVDRPALSPLAAPPGLATGAARLARAYLAERLAAAGVRLDGSAACDPRVLRERACLRIVAGGSLGAGDAYVDGDWECDALDELAARVAQKDALDRIDGLARPRAWLSALLAGLVNHQSADRAPDNVVRHYDRGDDLYTAMLGPTMVYSCGYWQRAATLDDAQRAKLSLVARKLGLRAGHRVLDLGCGWGGFARFAGELGAQVVGVTVSPAQAAHARAWCAGLPVEIQLADYRSLDGTFDRVVSIGMFEHVGPRNHRTFMERVHRCLAPGGLALLHTIGADRSTSTNDPWIDRRIFPGAVLPSLAQIARAAEGLFVIEDVHNFGADYDRTLMAWRDNFDAAWPDLRDDHDERFRRTWRYYLSTCAGLFRARKTQLYQVVLSKGGVRGGYERAS